jgi:hypothetical protein
VDFEKNPDPGAFNPTFDLIVPAEDPPAPEGETPPPPADPTGQDPLFEIDPPADAPEPGANAEESGDLVLGQILGTEEVYVFLKLELILMKDKDLALDASGLLEKKR